MSVNGEKPPTRTIGVVGIGSEEAVGAQTPDRPAYQGPAFGDVRDTLVALPSQPYADLTPSYVCSDIFPAKLEQIRRYAPDAVGVLEIGTFYGHFLLTALDACMSTLRDVWWADNELDAAGSNARVKRNIEWWSERLSTEDKVKMQWALTAYPLCLGALQTGAQIDIVHVDGCHTTEAAIADITMGLMLEPKMVIVDDTTAHTAVRAAVEFVAWNTGLQPEYHETVNGFAVIAP